MREGQGAQLETWLEEGSVDLAILFRMSPVPRNGDTYLFEAPTYLVSAVGDPLTSKPTVEFSALHNLPLVLFCRPSSWRNHLEQVAVEHDVSLNVALEADSLSMQTNIAAAGGIYTLLGPYAVAAACEKLSPAIIEARGADRLSLCRLGHVAARKIDARMPDRHADHT